MDRRNMTGIPTRSTTMVMVRNLQTDPTTPPIITAMTLATQTRINKRQQTTMLNRQSNSRGSLHSLRMPDHSSLTRLSLALVQRQTNRECRTIACLDRKSTSSNNLPILCPSRHTTQNLALILMNMEVSRMLQLMTTLGLDHARGHNIICNSQVWKGPPRTISWTLAEASPGPRVDNALRGSLLSKFPTTCRLLRTTLSLCFQLSRQSLRRSRTATPQMEARDQIHRMLSAVDA